MLDDRLQTAVLQRLRRISGQVGGLQRMVEDRRYCIDILNQVAAVEAALHRAAALMLKNHMETCVTEACDSSDTAARREKIDELVRAFDSMRPK